MFNSRRLGAITLACSMVAIGCGGDDDDDGGASETSPAAEGTGAATSEPPAEQPSSEDLEIGVAVFQFSNTYLTLVRNAITAQADAEGVAVDVVDGQNSQPTQNEQIDLFISKGYEAMAVNQVDRELANVTAEKALAADIPVVFFNKEPERSVLDMSDQFYYVGAVAEESGVMQGEIVVEYWNANPDADRNGDGVLQYVMLQGPADHQDAQLRTTHSMQTIVDAGVEVEELALEIGDWSRPLAQEDMSAILAAHGDAIEFVIANNDDMALGAIEALRANGYFGDDGKFMPVVGVDATAPALEALADGTLLATVLNDAENQGKATLTLAHILARGETPTEENVGYPITDGKYVWVPYQKILLDNIGDAG
jgi:methyl-galactoside transport system substrate-binding protein